MRAFVQDCYLGLPPSGDVIREVGRRGTSVHLFSGLDELRPQLRLPGDLVLGDAPTMSSLLVELGLWNHVVPSYPSSLTELLHRRVWTGTLDALRSALPASSAPLFAKPRDAPVFSGAVISSLDVVADHPGVRDDTVLHVAEVVEWNVECRIHVLGGQIVGCTVYELLGLPHCLPLDQLAGPRAVTVDPDVIEDAIDRLAGSADNVVAYALDLGVMTDGTTALIEVNDAFGLANVGLAVTDYVDLLSARWEELVCHID